MYITTLITAYDWDPSSHSGRSLVGVGLGPVRVSVSSCSVKIYKRSMNIFLENYMLRN